MTDIGEEGALKALDRLYQENESGLKWLAQMEQQHPVLPSQEQLTKWDDEYFDEGENFDVMMIKAFQAGADQELEACCKWLETGPYGFSIEATAPSLTKRLRAARRPKPPSLKEQALDSWDRLRNEAWCEEIDFDLDFIRRALESLPD